MILNVSGIAEYIGTPPPMRDPDPEDEDDE